VTSGRSVALGLVMRNALLVALVLLTAACGAYHFPGAAGSGTVTGQVTVIPCQPVKPVDGGIAPCKMAPISAAAGIEIIFTADGRVTSTRTDADGRYTIELPAGAYAVNVAKYLRIISGRTTVTVRAGTTVVADYVISSGILPAGPLQ
jgi:hypothetical protein